MAWKRLRVGAQRIGNRWILAGVRFLLVSLVVVRLAGADEPPSELATVATKSADASKSDQNPEPRRGFRFTRGLLDRINGRSQNRASSDAGPAGRTASVPTLRDGRDENLRRVFYQDATAGTPTPAAVPDGSEPPAASGSGESEPPVPPEGTSDEALQEESHDEPAGPTPMTLNHALGLDKSPVRVYGWIQNSYTQNTNGFGNGTNFGVYPNHLANQWQGNQYYLVTENPIEQGEKLNFGFRVDTLFGNDYQFTRSYGFFDRVFAPNSFLGLDFPQIYGEVHLPYLTKLGVDVKGGRYYTPMGYETATAINRPLLSIPYAYNFSPFTFLGVQADIHITDRLDYFHGTMNGWDRWFNENYRWGYYTGVIAKSKSGKTIFNSFVTVGPDQLPRFAPANAPYLPTGVISPIAFAGRPNPNYIHNNRFYACTHVIHKWTDKLTQVMQTDQIYDPNVLGLGPDNTARSGSWFSFVNWFLYEVNPKLTGVWRSEVFWDPQGQATGYADTFHEMTVGCIYKPKPWLWVRPEARYDWASFTHPFANGTRGSQLTLAVDVIVLY